VYAATSLTRSALETRKSCPSEAAERCYAKAGFAFAEEKRDPAFEAVTGAPGFRRFERAI
jgi:hypothetical protein